jgi:Lysozyme like domain
MARLSARQVAGIAAQGTPRGTTVAEWVQVAMDESSFNTEALSPTGCCRGLWQINVRAHKAKIPEAKVSIANGHQAMKSPLRNWEVAKMVYVEAGDWGPWDAVKGSKPRPSAEARAAAASPDYSIANSGGAVGGKPEEGVEAISVLDPVEAVAKSIFGGFEAIVDFLNRMGAWVSDPHNWVRVGYVAGGAALVIVAGAALAGPKLAPLAPGPVGKVARAIK